MDIFGQSSSSNYNKDISLQTRILDSVYSSLKGLMEEDPLENIREYVTICGEKYLDIHPQEQWDDKIVMYQQYDVDQVLLPDNANCLAVQAYLKMCDINVTIESRWNAEYMSPSGKIPFITCGPCIISDFDSIVSFINKRGKSLSEHLSNDEKANLRAYMSLVNNVLYYAELYICWCHDDTYHSVTKERHGRVYPWPLNHYLNWKKRNQIMKKLSIFPWAKNSLKNVFDEVTKCCDSLEKILANNLYFFGDRPNELDALVFSHIYILTTTYIHPKIEELANIIRSYPGLIKHAYLINEQYFKPSSTLKADSYELLQFSSDESVLKMFNFE